MDGVVSEQVHQVVKIHEWVVDGHDAGLAGLAEGGAGSEAADSAEAVDSESDSGHGDAVRVIWSSLFKID